MVITGGRWLAVGAALVALAGCGVDTPVGRVADAVAAPFRATPAWAQDPPREPGMVFGTGSGADRDTAVAAATRDLVSQIQVSVSVDDRTQETSGTTLASGADRLERYEAATRSDVRSRAEQRELPGLSVIRQEQLGDRVWVLLRLDRVVWAGDLSGRIQSVDERLKAAVAAQAGDSRPAAAVQVLRATAPLFVERDDLVSRLRAAEPGGTIRAEPVDRAALRRQVQVALDQVTVSLPAEPEFSDLQPALVDAFAKVGIRSAAPDQPGTVRLRLTLKTTPLRIDNQVRVDGDLRGTVEDAQGRRLAGIQLSDRSGAPAESVARDRLNLKLARRLADDLDRRLLDILQGL
jgi:hypothetical protein